jgi:hypothetical protein
MAVGHGMPWLGRATSQAQAAVLDYEQGAFEACRRIQALGAGFGLSAIDTAVAVCTQPEYFLPAVEFLPALTEALTTKQLLVVDSLRAATPGLDENDSNIRTYLDACRRLPGADRAALMFLAHARKGGGESREQLRGSGAIYDAADVVYMLGATDEGFTVAQTKNRFGQLLPSFTFRLADVAAAGVRLVDLPTNRARPGGVAPALRKRVLSVIARTPGVASRNLRALVGGNGARVDQAVNELIADGLVVRRGRSGFYLSPVNDPGAP